MRQTFSTNCIAASAQAVASADKVGGAIHNHCIALYRRYYRRYKTHLSLYTLHAHLAKLKQLPKYAWWPQLGSQAIQDIARRIDKGYQRFFQNVQERQAGKTTQRVGPPTFARSAKPNRSP